MLIPTTGTKDQSVCRFASSRSPTVLCVVNHLRFAQLSILLFKRNLKLVFMHVAVWVCTSMGTSAGLFDNNMDVSSTRIWTNGRGVPCPLRFTLIFHIYYNYSTTYHLQFLLPTTCTRVQIYLKDFIRPPMAINSASFMSAFIDPRPYDITWQKASNDLVLVSAERSLRYLLLFWGLNEDHDYNSSFLT